MGPISAGLFALVVAYPAGSDWQVRVQDHHQAEQDCRQPILVPEGSLAFCVPQADWDRYGIAEVSDLLPHD